MESMRRWIGAFSAAALIASSIVAVQLLPWPRGRDFPPFVMTIEHWNSRRLSLADGRVLAGTYVHRLEYERRDDWTLTLIGDDVPGYDPGPPREKPIACRNGVYGWIEPTGTFTVMSRDASFCNGVGRWIHYGMAWNWVWEKQVGDGIITYTDPGERVVFDATSGLPVLYEAGRVNGPVGERIVYRVERRSFN